MACMLSKIKYVGVECSATFYTRVANHFPELLLANFSDKELENLSQNQTDDARDLLNSIPKMLAPVAVSSPPASPTTKRRKTNPRVPVSRAPPAPARSAGKRPRELVQLHDQMQPIAMGGKRPRYAAQPIQYDAAEQPIQEEALEVDFEFQKNQQDDEAAQDNFYF